MHIKDMKTREKRSGDCHQKNEMNCNHPVFFGCFRTKDGLVIRFKKIA